MKVTPREKRRHAAGTDFLAWGDFHARSRFSLSLLSLRTNGGLLVVYYSAARERLPSHMTVAVYKAPSRFLDRESD